MKLKNKRFLLPITTLLFFFSCQKDNKEIEVEGYLPIYASEVGELIKLNDAPQKLSKPGKIYIYQDYLFVIETEEGIHIIDNSDKSAPVKKSFYKIPGCSEISVKDNFLYTNMGNGILTIDISNSLDAKLLNYTSFPNQGFDHPDKTTSRKDKRGFVNYVCPDTDKGIVVGWIFSKFSGKFCSI
jgi:hypothetical protein